MINSGSGDTAAASAFDLTAGCVELVVLISNSSGIPDSGGLSSSSPSTTQDSPNCSFPFPGGIVHVCFLVAICGEGGVKIWAAVAAVVPFKLEEDSK